MKKLLALITLSIITGTSFANELVEFNNVKSTKTRAEVKAELAADIASGEFAKFNSFYRN